MKIEIYESPLSDKVVATFSTKAELYAYNEKHELMADCVAIDGMIMLGWDEVESYPKIF